MYSLINSQHPRVQGRIRGSVTNVGILALQAHTQIRLLDSTSRMKRKALNDRKYTGSTEQKAAGTALIHYIFLRAHFAS